MKKKAGEEEGSEEEMEEEGSEEEMEEPEDMEEEGFEEEGMEGEPGFAARPPAGRPSGGGGAGPNPIAAMEFDFSAFEPAGASGNNYLTKAKAAFAGGDFDRAHEFLLQHIIVEPELAESAMTFQNARWSQSSRRPRWVLRLGIGINNAAVRHDGDLHPIQAEMKAPSDGTTGNNSSSSSSSMTFGGGNRAPQVGGGAAAEIERYTGLVGRVTGDMFAEKFANGDFGPIFVGAAPSAPAAPAAAPRANNAGFFDSENGEEMMEEEMMEEEMMEEEGGVEEEFGEEGMNSAPRSRFGGSSRPAGLPAAGMAQSNGSQFRPGLLYLGAGHPRDLLAKAQEMKLDAYLQFDVSVTKNGKNGWVYNDTSVKWVLGATGKPSGRASEKINNAKMFQASERRSLDIEGKVREAVAVLFTDALEFKLQPMPNLNESMIMSRVGSLIRTPPENPLEALAEVRLYHSLGLLDEQNVHLAFDLLLGDRGLILSAGDADSRIEQIDAGFSAESAF